jgi:hypothetical protein
VTGTPLKRLAAAEPLPHGVSARTKIDRAPHYAEARFTKALSVYGAEMLPDFKKNAQPPACIRCA